MVSLILYYALLMVQAARIYNLRSPIFHNSIYQYLYLHHIDLPSTSCVAT